jgi:exoribonuclease R
MLIIYKMFGTIKFSSRVQYGRNKRNLPYYLFEPCEYNEGSNKIIVASKLKSGRVDHYAEIEILDDTCNPVRGGIRHILGPVNDYDCTKKLILSKNSIIHKNKILCDVNPFDNGDKFDEFTYSIDPEGSKDIDDAFSYNFDKNILKVHITDLTDLDIQNLDDLINIGFTFYDNDGNINMLPSAVSEDAYSLLEGNVRRSITMRVNLKSGEIIFTRDNIMVIKNLTYTEADDLFDKDAKWLLFRNKVTEYIGEFDDTHKFIEKLMILYNTEFSKYLYEQKKNYPIRIHKGLKEDILNKSELIDDKLKKMICYYSAEYVPVNDTEMTLHKSLDIDKYTHASSPLRRLIDLINQRIAFNNINIDVQELCDKVNNRNKLFKNAYREIKLLDLSSSLKDSDNRIYDAIIIGFDEFKIKVYIPDLDIVNNIRIFNNNILKVFNINITDVSMDIMHIETNNLITLNLYQKIKVKTMIKLYESRLYKKIQFFVIDPYLVDLLD